MGFLDLIFPKTCLECGREGQYICTTCLDKVQIQKPVCPYCEKASIDGFTHIKCKKVFGLDGLTSIFKYEGVVKKAISSLKYNYATEITREICGYFLPELNKYIELTRRNLVSQLVLIPIPAYWYRENFRGFNQSKEMGKIVAEEMNWQFEPNLLFRRKLVKPQAGLSVEERKKNLHGVFAINTNFVLSTAYSVLLFDDVFTTGSTLHEACKVLKRAGVKKVWGMTVAR